MTKTSLPKWKIIKIHLDTDSDLCNMEESCISSEQNRCYFLCFHKQVQIVREAWSLSLMWRDGQEKKILSLKLKIAYENNKRQTN